LAQRGRPPLRGSDRRDQQSSPRRALDAAGVRPHRRSRWSAPGQRFEAALPDRLFTVSDDTQPTAAITAWRAADGHRLWRSPLPRSFRPITTRSVAVGGNALYAQDYDGRIAVFAVTDGRLLTILTPPWPSSEAGHLLASGGMLFESVLRNGTPPEPAGPMVAERPVLLAFGTD